MILAVDVDYRKGYAVAAGLLFERWQAQYPLSEMTSRIRPVNGYEPGFFYRRELPCILTLLAEHRVVPTLIIIDGLVFLDGKSQPGLGFYLHKALAGRVPVVGVAKNLFRGIGRQFALWRGRSTKPLYVTAVGIDLQHARSGVASMHGPFRLPSLLKQVDRLARSAYPEEGLSGL